MFAAYGAVLIIDHVRPQFKACDRLTCLKIKMPTKPPNVPANAKYAMSRQNLDSLIW